MSWESISFSTHKEPYWHLNRIIVSGSHSADDTSQLIARVNGIHYDNVTQHVHCTTNSKLKIMKEVSFVLESMIQEVRKYKNMRVVDVVRGKEWFSNRIPLKFIAPMKNIGNLSLKTKTNPEAAKEARIFKKNEAIEIFTKLHPKEYTKFRERINKDVIDDVTENIDKIDEDPDYEPTKGTKLQILKDKIIKYVTDNSDNTYKSHSEWFKITGLCGFDKIDGHHMAITTLFKKGILQRIGNKGKYLFKISD
jgi:hypothetical protein